MLRPRRYTEQLKITEAIKVMANGNSEAEECLCEMLKNGITGLLDIWLIDSLEIYGKNISDIWNESEHDPARLHDIMDTYRCQFTKASK